MATIYSTATEVAIKEDFSETITNIAPTATPFQADIGTRKVHNQIFSWLTDTLDPAGINANPEGFIASGQAILEPILLTGPTQILKKEIAVTGTDEAVELHGRDSQMGYQALKQAKAIKRDFEYACLNSQAPVVSGTRMLASYQAQIPGVATIPGYTGVNNVIGTGGATTMLTEANLVAALQLKYVDGSDDDNTVLMVTPNEANAVAAFAQASGKYRVLNDDEKKVTNAVTGYASMFGDVAVVINRFLQPGDALVYSPSYWQMAVLRNWHTKELPSNGDFEAKMLVGEMGLIHKSPIASVLIRQQ